ncbi:orotate phosphoribosyltransferase [Companilactobacillus sp. RD055328]|uniref:orotate phosphoribosyltransferase n=1 Tax=Companilactobacillus sp. RD055328 TaxID=2916634 RepID=UPI001FC7FD49|nr:orotate phosphoribosyltransferase [Companilactobacillus sp. RD055328]GKQ42786.1 orotate phosphoribosyltransferase [Companilactobacillus sp. RD055328]
MYTATDLIKDLLEIKAISLNVNNPYTWASGLKSPIYTDNRAVIAYPKIRQNIAQLLADKIRATYPKVTVIGGVATAGIPHATQVANILQLPLNYVRTTPKDHGKGKQIEGRCEAGDNVVLIDDLISTGGSILQTVDAIRDTGANVIGTAAIFSYGLNEADRNFADKNTELITIASFSDLIKTAREIDYITDDELTLLKKWHKDLKDGVTN